MRFVHIADVHFDVPFTTLKGIDNLDSVRRLEQRDAFNKVIEYVKREQIEYLFISGDLYENEYVKKQTIEYINNLFKTIPNTKIFISPGNHDPYIKESYYENFNFAENVIIFRSSKLEKYEFEDAIIYGAAFKDFYMNTSDLENEKIEKNEKNQVLVIHGDLNGNQDSLGYSYNPIKEKELNNFDYVALGHIHKTNYKDNQKIMYPGSLVALGFDELDNHGMVIGELNNKILRTDYCNLDTRKFIEHEIIINNFVSMEELVSELSALYFENNIMCKIVLKGNRKFEINIKLLEKLIQNPNIIKIKDETKLGYDLELIAQENTLRGEFVRKMLIKQDTGFYTEEEIVKAIEIGLEAME